GGEVPGDQRRVGQGGEPVLPATSGVTMGMLDGKAALVTGAGRGIGRGIALALARAGAKVVVNDLGASLAGEGGDTRPADQVVGEIVKAGGAAVPNHGSVADHAEATAMVEQVIRAYGRIDILVHVAGILRDRMLFNMTEAEWDAVIAGHLKGMFNCARAASVAMRARPGPSATPTTSRRSSSSWRATPPGTSTARCSTPSATATRSSPSRRRSAGSRPTGASPRTRSGRSSPRRSGGA